MGKGDKKSKRGKIIMGSYGVSRPKRKIVEKLVSSQTKSKPEKATVVETKPKPKVAEPKPKIAKKPKPEEKPENLKEVDEIEDKET